MKPFFLYALYLGYIVFGLLLNLAAAGGLGYALITDWFCPVTWRAPSKVVMIWVGLSGQFFLFASTLLWIFRLRSKPRKIYYNTTMALIVIANIWMTAWLCMATGKWELLFFAERFFVASVLCSPLWLCVALHKSVVAEN
jgi:hypothetical protein